MDQFRSVVSRGTTSALATNKVLRNTYMLLSLTLIFSAVMAGVSMLVSPPPMTGMISSIAAIVLLWFVLPRMANSSAGIGIVFLVTGLLGFGLGPLLNAYMAIEGGKIIGLALGGTGVIFMGLSGYVLTTRKDFSFLGGFLAVGILVAFIAILANIFLAIPALQLAISAAIIFIMSGFILYDTSRIIHGGETNYVLATVSLYISIYNIFVSLLQILGAFSGDD